MSERNAYHFITEWVIPSEIDEIYELLKAAEELPRWWPSVYREVTLLETGDADGVGNVYDLYTKGRLPYTLRWRFRVTENIPPTRLALAAWGDFVGTGVWTLSEAGPGTRVTYDWNISAQKPLLQRLSFLFKPVFSANHRWAMTQGEESLLAELNRLGKLRA